MTRLLLNHTPMARLQLLLGMVANNNATVQPSDCQLLGIFYASVQSSSQAVIRSILGSYLPSRHHPVLWLLRCCEFTILQHLPPMLICVVEKSMFPLTSNMLAMFSKVQNWFSFKVCDFHTMLAGPCCPVQARTKFLRLVISSHCLGPLFRLTREAPLETLLQHAAAAMLRLAKFPHTYLLAIRSGSFARHQVPQAPYT